MWNTVISKFGGTQSFLNFSEFGETHSSLNLVEHSHYQLSETWQFLNLVELGLFSIWWSMAISWFGGTWSTEIIFVEFSLSSIEWNNVNSQFSTNQRNKTLPQPINRGIFSWPCGFGIVLVTLWVLNTVSCLFNNLDIELYNNSLHGLSPLGGLVSPSGGFASLLCDQGLHLHW